MTASSLRMRLLAAAAVATGTALCLAWLAMTLIFERHIERRLAIELEHQATPLVAALRIGGGGRPELAVQPADPRFGLPSSGLYWQVSTGSGLIRSRSLWDSSLPPARSSTRKGWQRRIGRGPFGQDLLYVEREVRPDRGSPPATIQLAADVDPLRQARNEFGRELSGFLLLLGIALLLAAWFQVRTGLRPLDDVAGELGRLRSDPTARLSGGYPAEIVPLTAAIDALADARETDLRRARTRAADLAHGLKTPLAALQGYSGRVRDRGDAAAADGLDVAITALSDTIYGELRRSRVAAVTKGQMTAKDVARLVDSVVELVERAETGRQKRFEIELDAASGVPLSSDDFTELLGCLVDNAARHAHSHVRISTDAGRRLTIEDDGEGIGLPMWTDALLRGVRVDETGGHGMGLAIANDIVLTTGGRLELTHSLLGGLKAEAIWP